MKKSHADLIVEYFEQRGWKATLGELLEAGQYSFAHKLTARLSDLRARGYEITCEVGPNPSQNLYTMTPPFRALDYAVADYSFESTGQGVLL